MAIPSQQIGWSQRAKLLWNISKQLEKLIQVTGNVTVPCPECPTTTTTTTTAGLFSGTIEYSVVDVCGAPEGSFAVTGNAATFCDCTELTGVGFESLSSFTIYQIKPAGDTNFKAYMMNGASVVTSSDPCGSCP